MKDSSEIFTTLLRVPKPRPGEQNLQRVLVFVDQRSIRNVHAKLDPEGLAVILGCNECESGNPHFKIPAIFDVRKRRAGSRLVTTFKCVFAEGANPGDVNAPPCVRKR